MNLWSALCLLILCSVLGCSLPAKFRAPASQPVGISESCSEWIQKLPKDFTYGWVESSERPEVDKRLPPVHTFYYGRMIPGQTPVVFFNGGPGLYMHENALLLRSEIETQLGTELPLLFIDQRGAGCSTPYPANRPPQDYFYWGAKSIVRDAEKVREALGVSKWHLFGHSYGGFVVQRYLEMHPERILKAVSQGGVVVSNLEDVTQLRAEQQIHTLKKYLSLFPASAQRISTIVKKRKCSQWGCGAQLIKNLAFLHLGSQRSWKNLNQELSTAARSRETLPLKALSDSMPLSAHEQILFVDAGVAHQVNCAKVRTLYLRAFGEPEFLALSDCWGLHGNSGWSGEDFAKRNAQLKAMGLAPVNNQTLRNHLERFKSIEFHLFSSEWDYNLPDAVVSRAASEIGPRVHFHRLLGATHDAYAKDAVVEIFKIFLPNSN